MRVRPAIIGAVLLAAVALIATSCSDSVGDADAADDAAATGDGDGDGATDNHPVVDLSTIERGEDPIVVPAPAHPDGPWSDDVSGHLDSAIATLTAGSTPVAELDALRATSDPRLAWALADLLRFTQGSDVGQPIASAIEDLTGMTVEPTSPWTSAVSQLMRWDLPVPPQYVDFKRTFYGTIEPRWAELFSDNATIDWRFVGWGGVGIDARPLGSEDGCRCIPALDDPVVTDAAGGDWYPDDGIVFGVEVGDEARAYPKNIMEVHEMVNDTLGDRRLAIPYCTLCGSAQAFLTDELGEEFPEPVLRTSGLLLRSNKMMYELNTTSFVDTFLGHATSGPLADAGVTFEQVSVVTTTWAGWKDDHPDTTIIAEDGGIGRSYDLDPLRGRDDSGPIFPIGDADPRLPVQEPVLGIVIDGRRSVAFHVETAVAVLTGGEAIIVDGVALELDGDGVRAVRADGADAQGHQSFWFAWSQFHPGTELWPHDFQPDS